MNQMHFEKLMERLECDCADLNGTIGFSGKFSDYAISFYGDSDDDFQLIIDDFGYYRQFEWTQLTPTEDQIVVMQKVLDEKAEKLHMQKLEEEEWEKECEIYANDPYAYNGVSRSDFF